MGESIHRIYGKRQIMRLSFHGLGRNLLIAGNNVALQSQNKIRNVDKQIILFSNEPIRYSQNQIYKYKYQNSQDGRHIRKSNNPKYKKVARQYSINQVFRQKFEKQKQRQQHSTPNQWEPHCMFIGHCLLQNLIVWHKKR